MKRKGYFVTGIGTGVGKTVVSSVLCQTLNYDYWKPIQCGDVEKSDSLKVQSLTKSVKVHPEAYRFHSGVAPLLAAKIEGVSIDIRQILAQAESIENAMIVEGAGGVLVPMSRRHLFVDLIRSLGLPVIVVVRPYLGSVNHTLLTLECLKRCEVPIAGVVFSGEDRHGSKDMIVDFSDVKILGEISETELLDHSFVLAESKKSWCL